MICLVLAPVSVLYILLAVVAGLVKRYRGYRRSTPETVGAAIYAARCFHTAGH